MFVGVGTHIRLSTHWNFNPWQFTFRYLQSRKATQTEGQISIPPSEARRCQTRESLALGTNAWLLLLALLPRTTSLGEEREKERKRNPGEPGCVRARVCPVSSPIFFSSREPFVYLYGTRGRPLKKASRTRNLLLFYLTPTHTLHSNPPLVVQPPSFPCWLRVSVPCGGTFAPTTIYHHPPRPRA